MIVRRGKKNDIAACMKLSESENKGYWTRPDFARCVSDKHVIFLVAEENKKLAGFINGFIVPTKLAEAMIHETRVDPKQRGRDIGTKMVDAFCKAAFKKGARTVYALIDKNLEPFYIESCKFKKSGFWIETSKKR